MSPRLSAQILITLSIAYSITIAILGFVGSPGMTVFAFVGAVVIGGLWAIRSVFMNRDQTR